MKLKKILKFRFFFILRILYFYYDVMFTLIQKKFGGLNIDIEVFIGIILFTVILITGFIVAYSRLSRNSVK